MWHEWNANAGDVMVTWFTSYVMMGMHIMQHMHGTHAILKWVLLSI